MNHHITAKPPDFDGNRGLVSSDGPIHAGTGIFTRKSLRNSIPSHIGCLQNQV